MKLRAERVTSPRGRVAILVLTILLVGCADGPTVVSDVEVLADFSGGSGESQLYFTTWFPGAIWSANLDGSRAAALVYDEPGRPTGIGFDDAGSMYWTRWIGGSVSRADQCGENVTTIRTVGNSRGLAIDRDAGFLYITDLTGGLGSARVTRTTLEGTGLVTLTSGIRNAGPLALDAVHGHLFTNDLNQGHTFRVNTDGSGRTLIRSGPLSFGFAVDVPSNHLYFTVHDLFPGFRVGRMALDGSNLVGLVAGGGPDARGIVLDLAAGKMYWTVLNEGVYRANLDGSGASLIVPADPAAGLANFHDITIGPGCARPIQPVEIDIRPGSDETSISANARGGGSVPVAILTTDAFDASIVDGGSVTLGDDRGSDVPVSTRGNGEPRAALEDVDLDGDADLVLHFDRAALVAGGDLTSTTTQLCVNGETHAGIAIHGCAAVRVVP